MLRVIPGVASLVHTRIAVSRGHSAEIPRARGSSGVSYVCARAHSIPAQKSLHRYTRIQLGVFSPFFVLPRLRLCLRAICPSQSVELRARAICDARPLSWIPWISIVETFRLFSAGAKLFLKLNRNLDPSDLRALWKISTSAFSLSPADLELSDPSHLSILSRCRLFRTIPQHASASPFPPRCTSYTDLKYTRLWIWLKIGI